MCIMQHGVMSFEYVWRACVLKAYPFVSNTKIIIPIRSTTPMQQIHSLFQVSESITKVFDKAQFFMRSASL